MRQLQGLQAIARFDDGVALVLQTNGEQREDLRIVVRDQDGRFLCGGSHHSTLSWLA